MPTASDGRSIVRSPVLLGMLVLYLVWGSTYLGVAIAVDTIPPFMMAGGRFFLAGLALFAWSVGRGGRDFRMPSPVQIRDAAIVGTLLVSGGMGLVAVGEQTVPSGITALLIALMPLFVAILGRIFLAQRLPRTAVVGILTGFVGIAILVGPTALGTQGALDPVGLALILVSPIAWATGSLFASHRATLPSKPLVNAAFQMLSGGLVLLAMAGVTGEFGRFDASAVSSASLEAFLYLTLVGSLIAFTTYGWLLGKAPLPLVSTYAYVNPVVAVILGAIVLGEVIDLRTVVAGAVILVAVALIVTARGRMPLPRPAVRGTVSQDEEAVTTAAPTAAHVGPGERAPTS
jgi:drug/metabolite transporter (DMT)-like permease